MATILEASVMSIRSVWIKEFVLQKILRVFFILRLQPFAATVGHFAWFLTLVVVVVVVVVVVY